MNDNGYVQDFLWHFSLTYILFRQLWIPRKRILIRSLTNESCLYPIGSGLLLKLKQHLLVVFECFHQVAQLPDVVDHVVVGFHNPGNLYTMYSVIW
jgi:hypothetical protein